MSEQESVELRLVESRDHDRTSEKGYRRSYAIIDETRDAIVCTCHLMGQVEFGNVFFEQDDEVMAELKPNRKIMPSKWQVMGTDGVATFDIERPSAASMMNPWGRRILTITNLKSSRRFDLMNLEDSNLDLVLGTGPTTWALLEGETPVASIERRKRPGAPEGQGFLNKVKRFFTSSDWVLVSPGSRHVLSPAAFLATVMLFESLTTTTD